MGGISEIEFMSPFCGNIRFVAIIKAMLLCSPVFFPTNAETWLFRERQDETFQEISSRQLILRCCFSLVAKKTPKDKKQAKQTLMCLNIHSSTVSSVFYLGLLQFQVFFVVLINIQSLFYFFFSTEFLAVSNQSHQKHAF